MKSTSIVQILMPLCATLVAGCGSITVGQLPAPLKSVGTPVSGTPTDFITNLTPNSVLGSVRFDGSTPNWQLEMNDTAGARPGDIDVTVSAPTADPQLFSRVFTTPAAVKLAIATKDMHVVRPMVQTVQQGFTNTPGYEITVKEITASGFTLHIHRVQGCCLQWLSLTFIGFQP